MENGNQNVRLVASVSRRHTKILNYQMHLCKATFSLTSHKLPYLLVTLSLLLFILNDVGQRLY